MQRWSQVSELFQVHSGQVYGIGRQRCDFFWRGKHLLTVDYVKISDISSRTLLHWKLHVVLKRVVLCTEAFFVSKVYVQNSFLLGRSADCLGGCLFWSEKNPLGIAKAFPQTMNKIKSKLILGMGETSSLLPKTQLTKPSTTELFKKVTGSAGCRGVCIHQFHAVSTASTIAVGRHWAATGLTKWVPRCSFPPSAHKDSLWNKSVPGAENFQDRIRVELQCNFLFESVWIYLNCPWSTGHMVKTQGLDIFLPKAKSEGWRLLKRNHIPNPEVYSPLLWETIIQHGENGSLDPRSVCSLPLRSQMAWKIQIKYVVNRAPMTWGKRCISERFNASPALFF